ncbi:MAG: DUF2199 domain-containing protein [Cyanobacteria bacterium J06649_11]
MENYKCDICGKKHPVFRAMKSPSPAMIRDMSDKERDERVFEHDGLYIVDRKHMLLNGWIQIFHKDDISKSFFDWQAWVSVDAREFADKRSRFEMNKEVRIKGNLDSEVPFYEKEIGLEVEILFSPTQTIPTIHILEQSELKEDQSKPISTIRIQELMSRLHHRELFVPPVHFDTPFIIRLREELETCRAKYGPDAFIINVSSSTQVLFQIIPRKYLEGENDLQSGYGFHITFDFEDESSLEYYELLRHLDDNKNWQFHEIDGVPTYQLDVQNDETRLGELSVKLIEEVFLAQIGQIQVDSFEV